MALRGDKPGLMSGDFIILAKSPLPRESCPEGIIFKKHELKFHVSLPEDNPEQFARGWDIVNDIIIENKIRQSKVAHEEVKMSSTKNGMQRGKDITIYAKYNPEKSFQDWKTILQTITDQLVAANVSPGYRQITSGSRYDNLINGSNYIGYRYEKKLA